MLVDPSTVVQKRVVQALTFLYRCCLKWLCQVRIINDKMEAVWGLMNDMKANIITILDGDNDGLRTLAIKFIEVMILCQTHAEDYGKVAGPHDFRFVYYSAAIVLASNLKGFYGKSFYNFSLEDVPMTLKFLRRRKLEEEARSVFDELLKFHGSAYIR